MTAETPSTTSAWPTEIRLKADKRTLVVGFDDGEAFEIPAELLRVRSPSAEVQGHSPAERKLVPGMADITITRVEPVGSYAVRLVFADGHSTGIYTWSYLREAGERTDELMRAYITELENAGLSRQRR